MGTFPGVFSVPKCSFTANPLGSFSAGSKYIVSSQRMMHLFGFGHKVNNF